jgi:hypothetical protein
MFGSWMGEWDSTDNLTRTVLATKSLGLTCSWSGRPHWFYHHMGLGEPIGYSARIAMNNNGLYQNQVNSQARGVHIALMGDPTLRMHQVAPPANVTASGNTVTWDASTESVAGYHVYRAASPEGPFTRLTTSLVTGTSFTDSNASSPATYMVRAVKLENTPTGTYFNPSQGILSTTTTSNAAAPKLSVAKAQSGGLLLTWTSQAGKSYRVQTKDAKTGTWTDLSGAINATGSTTSWTDTNAGQVNGARVYRVYVP